MRVRGGDSMVEVFLLSYIFISCFGIWDWIGCGDVHMYVRTDGYGSLEFRV